MFLALVMLATEPTATEEPLPKLNHQRESQVPLSDIKDSQSAPQIASGHVSLGLSILNLLKNIIGTSMISMSFGIACSGVMPSIFICILFAVLSGYTFGLLGILCGEARVDSYRKLCEKYIGQRVGVWIDVLMALYTLPACIAYSIFVCDCMRKMLVDMIPYAADEFYTSRAFIGLVLTVGVLLPLCSLSKLDSLTYTSLLGIGAIIYCYIFVAIDLSKNADTVNATQTVMDALWWPPSGSVLGLFPMANIWAACYLVQYNSPKFYQEMKNPTKKRFFTLSFSTNAIVAVFCGSFAIMGFARFGLGTPDNLLIGYDKVYPEWIATCVSLITTYPFVFDAGRRSLMSALEGHEFWTPRRIFWTSTFVLIPTFSIIAIFVDSLSLVVGINGSLLGMTVGFSLPGYLLVKREQIKKRPRGVLIGWIIVVFGILMSILGMLSIFIHVRPTG